MNYNINISDYNKINPLKEKIPQIAKNVVKNNDINKPSYKLTNEIKAELKDKVLNYYNNEYGITKINWENLYRYIKRGKNNNIPISYYWLMVSEIVEEERLRIEKTTGAKITPVPIAIEIAYNRKLKAIEKRNERMKQINKKELLLKRLKENEEKLNSNN